MDAEQRRLFSTSVREAVSGSDATGLDHALANLGWVDALQDDPHAAVAAVFEAQGNHCVTSSALDDVLSVALGFPAGDRAVVLPLFSEVDPPARLIGDRIVVRGLATTRLAARGAGIVVVQRAADCCATEVGELDAERIRGIDPAAGLLSVTAELASFEVRDETVIWADALAAGQVALAHELLGVSRAMLRLARQHASERVQFDRPIAGFQAVRHRLADAHVAAESTAAALDGYWVHPSGESAAIVKAIAGHNARTVARHAQQVLAGIGFTLEHPLHHYVRRTLTLDGLLGSAWLLTRKLGEDVLARRELPAPIPL